VLPAVQATTRKHLQNPEHQADAEQLAFLKVWTAVKGYNRAEPVRNAEAFCRRLASWASLNVVERQQRIAEHEQADMDDSAKRDAIEYRDAEPVAPEEDSLSLVDFAKYAREKAGGGDKGDLWASIVLAVSAGHDDRETIGQVVAQMLGRARPIPAVSIRREIWQMKSVLNLDALDKREVLTDWRTIAEPAGDEEQSALFAYEFKEIA
jgi:hypothetical protein